MASRSVLLTMKFNICGNALVLTQFLRKEDCAEWLADLGQLTLGDEVWLKRLYASIVDGEKSLADHRFMSNAYTQLGYLYDIACADGWLADADKVSFAQLAVQLAAFDLLKLEGGGVRSKLGSARHCVPAKTLCVTASRRSCASSRRTGSACTRAARRTAAASSATRRSRRSTSRRSRCSRTASR